MLMRVLTMILRLTLTSHTWSDDSTIKQASYSTLNNEAAAGVRKNDVGSAPETATTNQYKQAEDSYWSFDLTHP